ncbi:hypothetical protein VTK56DRAFT_9694 [Thermocarpiscus australiensis]
MPDLNSVPPSPHFLAASSRRPSSQPMPPPPAPGSPSLNILPSNQSAVNASSSSALPSPQFIPLTAFPGPSLGDNSGVSPGPGPLRHPRPLTAADLHLQLEKEQEAVVNRLTRELSILRAAHNASVVSNASSTAASASGTEPAHFADTPHSGLSHYQRVRHHRTSSSASARSFTANVGSVSTASLAGISSPAPVRPSQPAFATGGVPLSRQNSSASRRSRAGSPSPARHPSFGSYTQQHPQPLPHHPSDPALQGGYFAARVPLRPSLSGNASGGLPTPGSSAVATATPTPLSTTTTSTPAGASELSPGILPGTSRYEETATRRAELEEMKRENEALRRRVRELERMVREAVAGRDRDASASTQREVDAGASPRRDGQGQGRAEAEEPEAAAAGAPGTVSSAVSVVGVGVPEEEVRVGESAASAGLGGERGRE